MPSNEIETVTVGSVEYGLKDGVARQFIEDEQLFHDLVTGRYEGRNLAAVHADEIADYSGNEAAWFNARIIAGNFDGIYIRDYFYIELTDGKVFRYRVGAIDPYLHCGDQEITMHHIMMVPDTVWPDTVVWNTTNSNNGISYNKYSYNSSNLKKWELETFFPLLPEKWKAVISDHRLMLEQRYSTSGTLTDSNAWNWTDTGKIWSLSETEVYGSCVWGTKGYSVAMDCQFPIFYDAASRIRRNPDGERYGWWLRDAASGNSTAACNVHSGGNTGNSATSYTDIHALPCFRVGVA